MQMTTGGEVGECVRSSSAFFFGLSCMRDVAFLLSLVFSQRRWMDAVWYVHFMCTYTRTCFLASIDAKHEKEADDLEPSLWTKDADDDGC